MKILFGASSAQADSLGKEFQLMMDLIISLGHNLFLVVNPLDPDIMNKMSDSEDKLLEAFRKWKALTEKIDIAVVETSYPSSINLGAGIAYLLDNGKPVISLYKKGMNPMILDALYSNKLIRFEYTKETLDQVLINAIDLAKEQLTRRFTMNISGKIEAYLDSVSKSQGISKSYVIRKLIEKEIN